MNAKLLYGPPAATLTRLLGHTEFASAAQIVGHLDAALATKRLPGTLHSIAEIVAHMLSNMESNLDMIAGREPQQRGDWPAVSEAAWPALTLEFLDVNQQLLAYAQQPELLERVIFAPTDSEPGWTVGYKLAVKIGVHNAYHFGQIVTLRQQLGAWPG
ncbi:DinB family protein [Deinococcus sp.]|uniref:DinB family protein n=1 Tax=Deinococcus sp. TaxID=47478 RepID=UPI003B5CA414